MSKDYDTMASALMEYLWPLSQCLSFHFAVYITYQTIGPEYCCSMSEEEACGQYSVCNVQPKICLFPMTGSLDKKSAHRRSGSPNRNTAYLP